MRTSKKVMIAAISLILAIVVIYLAQWLIRYQFYYEYRKDVTSYEYEEGRTFSAIKESASDVDGMELAAENDTLKLYVDTKMGNVAVVDKRNGQITYSNPVGLEDDAIANEANKNYMRSQLIVDYFNTAKTVGTLDSYSYAAERDQIEVEAVDNGIRFIYTLGDLSSATGIVPQYISAEALERVASALSESDAKEVTKKYIESDVQDDYLELMESTMKGASQLRKLNRYFEEAGFTEEMYIEEMENSGVEGAVPISFIIPLEYRLNGDAVDVSIPMSAVEENGGGALYRIQMLRYLGAAGTDENGYLLVPNGSGSLIYFNNGKPTADVYSEYVYGIDPLSAEYTVRENTENVKMALYGIFRDDSAIFATIESGASLASIGAGVSGKVNEYNNAYATFIVRGNDKLSMFGTTGNEAEIPIVENHFYDANLSVRYTMLTQENATYAGAANYYRNRLVEEGVLTAKTTETEDIKLYYDTLGGVMMQKYVLGVPYNGMYPMTTFEQAGEIYSDLKSRGITNQVMNYQGWMNRGYTHDAANKIKVPRSLGGKSGLENLSALMAADGNDFYADTAFQQVTYVSRRYSANNETSRYYGGGYIAEFGLVNPATLRQTSGLGYEENHFFLISPKFLVRNIDKFTNKIGKYDINGISLRDLGNELHSDKKRTNVINRDASLDVVNASLRQITDTGKRILLNDANDYAFAYADDIINVPLTDNDYYIVDEAVPFYEMLIHGYIDYSGGTINLSDTYDRTDIVLGLVETGASPHFMFSANHSSDIKQTGLNRFYATTYENWKDDALAIYKDVNDALKYVQNAAITDHRIIDSNLRAVTYDNGVTIYINTDYRDKTADGITVPARSYQIGGM
ncbi:MAG: DUF5696 domain-containing protein [Bacteroidales bacterium]|nr:DUF5696 domain-containing protein [Bacteroidales bacterium]MCM1414724.1 DUF5696 domain-containing protein [bacterium]MCM1422533.1 DUF5696 domain-containing protein [bacterium]